MDEPTPPFDLYGTLEISPTASVETIEAAWRSLMKRNHPDIMGPEAEAVTRRLNIAHDWLIDPALRARYDRERPVGKKRTKGRGQAHGEPEPVRDEAPLPYPIPLTTAWTIPLLIERAWALSPHEIQAILATEADLRLRSDGLDAFMAKLQVRDKWIAAAGSRAEADWRRSQTSSGQSPAWPAYSAAHAAAERGPAWASASQVAHLVHESAEALIWRDSLRPDHFARLMYPFVAAVGEPQPRRPSPNGARWSTSAPRRPSWPPPNVAPESGCLLGLVLTVGCPALVLAAIALGMAAM